LGQGKAAGIIGMDLDEKAGGASGGFEKFIRAILSF